LISDDVVHSFAIGQSDFEPVDVLPGKPTDITLNFDEPGTYTFYCTRWCGADHWRMRGTITITGDEPVEKDAPEPPLYLQLGIDLDAPQPNHDLDWVGPPSLENGAALGVDLPSEFLTTQYYRAHSPLQTWEDLRAIPITDDLSKSQIWDLVAWVWQQNTTPDLLAEGEALYQRDCAACHGITGAGDGIFGAEETSEHGSPHETSFDGHSIEVPTNFQDANHMLTISPAFLQGKIIRGGMGTGMPSWGLIYTEEQTWTLVDYLWTFIFYPIEE
jgi:mono/diheme cytochrome c family protein